MKDGHAVYMNKFIKNPSKPQLEIFKMVKEVYPSAVLNFPFAAKSGKHYSLDIVIPETGVAIEYDGSHWHLDPEKDVIRQRDCEISGLRFIRFADRIPPQNELIESIERIVLCT